MAVKANNFGKLAMAALAASTLAIGAIGGASGAMATDVDPTQAPTTEPLTEEEVVASRALFAQYGCNQCHVFADANGSGHIGPALDGNEALSYEYVERIVTNGQGAMPSFGWMSAEEINSLSRYIVQNKAD